MIRCLFRQVARPAHPEAKPLKHFQKARSLFPHAVAPVGLLMQLIVTFTGPTSESTPQTFIHSTASLVRLDMTGLLYEIESER